MRGRRDGGTAARRHDGTAARRHDGTAGRRHGGTAARRHSGTAAQRHSGTTGRWHGGTLNRIDTGYRTELKELNEANFARFDDMLERRVAELRAELAERFASTDRLILGFG